MLDLRVTCRAGFESRTLPFGRDRTTATFPSISELHWQIAKMDSESDVDDELPLAMILASARRSSEPLAGDQAPNQNQPHGHPEQCHAAPSLPGTSADAAHTAHAINRGTPQPSSTAAPAPDVRVTRSSARRATVSHSPSPPPSTGGAALRADPASTSDEPKGPSTRRRGLPPRTSATLSAASAGGPTSGTSRASSPAPPALAQDRVLTRRRAQGSLLELSVTPVPPSCEGTRKRNSEAVEQGSAVSVCRGGSKGKGLTKPLNQGSGRGEGTNAKRSKAGSVKETGMAWIWYGLIIAFRIFLSSFSCRRFIRRGNA